MSNIVIFGSTCTTGLCVLEAAVKRDLSVCILVRDPSKVPSHLRDKVQVIEGNVLNYEDVLKATKEMDAATVILGTRNDCTADLSDAIKNIVQAMHEENVPVVSVCLSALLFHEEGEIEENFKELAAEHRRQYDVVKKSDLKYICVMPPSIIDQPPTGYRIEFDSSPGCVVSQYDLAEFLIDALSKPEYYCHNIGIKSNE